MFARAASVFVLALPLAVSATAVPRNDPGTVNQCNSGSLQCCSSVTTATTPSTSLLLGLLGVVVGTVTGLVGLTCSPISAVAVDGTSCNQQAVCCTNDSFNGLIALGCTPINLNL